LPQMQGFNKFSGQRRSKSGCWSVERENKQLTENLQQNMHICIHIFDFFEGLIDGR